MFWKETSDAEVIERARRSLRQLERWGRWSAAFHYFVAICMALVIAWVGQRLFNLLVGAQNRLELAIGFIIGVFFGTMLHQVIHNVVIARLARVPDGRDRLLVQYHDALTECVRRNGAADDDLADKPDRSAAEDTLPQHAVSAREQAEDEHPGAPRGLRLSDTGRSPRSERSW